MTRTLAIAFALFFISFTTFSQNYGKYMQQGKNAYQNSEYMTALERFDLAYEFAQSSAEKSDSKNWKNKCKSQIKQQQTKLEQQQIALKKALNVAEEQEKKTLIEKLKSDSLLIVANSEKRKAHSLVLAATASELLSKSPTKALRLAELGMKYTREQHFLCKKSLFNIYNTIVQKNIPLYQYFENEGYEFFTTVEFSPDGTKLLAFTNQKNVQLWDVSGKLLTQIEKDFEYSKGAIFSPDGSKILVESNFNTLQIYDLSGKLLAESDQHPNLLNSMAFSPDGEKVITASVYAYRVWEYTKNISQKAFYKVHDTEINSAFFSPDGTMIVTASNDKTVKLWDLSGNKIMEYESDSEVQSAIFSPDNTKILASVKGAALLLDLSGKVLNKFSHSTISKTPFFSPDGSKIMTIPPDSNIVNLWDINGIKIADLKGHKNSIASCLFSPDGTNILTEDIYGVVKKWDLTGKELMDISFKGMSPYQTDYSDAGVQYTPDGTQIMTKYNKLWSFTEQLFDIQTPLNFSCTVFDNKTKVISETNPLTLIDLKEQKVTYFKGHSSKWINSTALSKDKTKVLTCSDDKTAKLWDLKGTLLANFTGHKAGVSSAVFSPDETKILTVSNDKTAKVWNLSGKLLGNLNKHKAEIESASFSSDGKCVLTVSRDKTVKLWNTSGKLLVDFKDNPSEYTRAQFSPDGKSILITSDTLVRLHDLKGDLITDFKAGKSRFRPMNCRAKFSPDGKIVLIEFNEHNIQLRDLSGKLLAKLDLSGGVKSYNFINEGKNILTTCQGTPKIEIWDLSGNLISQYEYDFGDEIVFSKDSSMLLTNGHDGYAFKLWNKKGELVTTFSGHTKEVTNLLFSPNEKYILSRSSDESVCLWNLSGKMIGEMRNGDRIYSAFFSQDGKKIYTISEKNIKVWYTPEGIMEWLKTANIYKLKNKDFKELSLDFMVINNENDIINYNPELALLVTEMDLRENHIEMLPKEIGKFKNLEKLYLKRNNLKELPKEIKELKQLKYVNIKENPISVEEYIRFRKIAPKKCKVVSEFGIHEMIANINSGWREGISFDGIISMYYLFEDANIELTLSEQTLLADIFIKKGDQTSPEKTDSIIWFYKKSVEIAPDYYNGWSRLGNRYQFINFDSAVYCYEKSLNINRIQNNAWNNLSYCYNRLGKYEKAIEAADKQISINGLGNSYAHKAYALIKKEDLKNASSNLEKCAQYTRSYNKQYFYWACYYSKIKETEKAIENLNTAIEYGFDDINWIEKETCLDNIRNTPDYQLIIDKFGNK